MTKGNAPAGSVDLFAQVPKRVTKALLLGDLTFDQFGVAAFLCLAADYRTDTFTGTLGTIKDALQWGRSRDKLGRDLDALKARGWINFDVQQGQRKPYVIRLTGLLPEPTSATTSPATSPFTSPATSAGTPPLAAEVTSARRKSAKPTNPDSMPSGELVRLPRAGGALDVDVEVDVDADIQQDLRAPAALDERGESWAASYKVLTEVSDHAKAGQTAKALKAIFAHWHQAGRDERELPAEIRRLAAVYRQRMPDAILTPTALADWWHDVERLRPGKWNPTAAEIATMYDHEAS